MTGCWLTARSAGTHCVRLQLPVRTANSVCYMNIINPADVGLGEGALYNLTQAIR